MKGRQKKPLEFKEMLDKYIAIKGLDIVVHLKTGESIELYKNRDRIDDEIVTFDKKNLETRIAIPDVSSVDLFAM